MTHNTPPQTLVRGHVAAIFLQRTRAIAQRRSLASRDRRLLMRGAPASRAR
jgi:hypothetical protein